MKYLDNAATVTNEPMKRHSSSGLHNGFMPTTDPCYSNLNIRLKTHSLTSLNIPLRSSISFDEIALSKSSHHRNILAGSVDSISEIQHQYPRVKNDCESSVMAKSRPSIDCVNQKELKRAQSFFIPNSMIDSIAKLRRNRPQHNFHRSSLQNIRKTVSLRASHSSLHPRSLPKFSFRDLPSNHRLLTSSNQRDGTEKIASKLPFTSLPEISIVNGQHQLHKTKSMMDKFNIYAPVISSPWKKSNTWSWKSSNACRGIKKPEEPPSKSLIRNEPGVKQHAFRTQLPAIIESPIQQRHDIAGHKHVCPSPSLQILNNIQSKTNQSQRFTHQSSSIVHSFSNYEISSNPIPLRSSIQYPSTPLLTNSSRTNTSTGNLYSSMLPITMADIDDDDDSISSQSTFRSCFDSTSQLSDYDNTEMTCSVTQSYLDELSSEQGFHIDLTTHIKKQSRSSLKHICIIQ